MGTRRAATVGSSLAPPPPHAALPTKLWETSTSKTLSQTALTTQSPSSYPACCLRSRGELPKTVNQSLLWWW